MSADVLSQRELESFLRAKGVADVGFCAVEGEALPYAVSIVVRLSQAVVAEITDEPTHTYFSHYRTVNAFIDRTLLEAGFFLQSRGYRYIPVAASQSINRDGKSYSGRFSHKQAACLAGLGFCGKNTLFIHKKFGSCVRLGTLLTDFEPKYDNKCLPSSCDGCNICIRACPADAISENGFDAQACSEYMKRSFQHIGRGAVCGICMRACPKSGID